MKAQEETGVGKCSLFLEKTRGQGTGMYFRDSNLGRKSSWDTGISLRGNDMFAVHCNKFHIFNSTRAPCHLHVSCKLQCHYWDTRGRGPVPPPESAILLPWPPTCMEQCHLATRTWVSIMGWFPWSSRCRRDPLGCSYCTLTPTCSCVGQETRSEMTSKKKPWVFALIQLGLGFKRVRFEGKYLSPGVKKGRDVRPLPLTAGWCLSLEGKVTVSQQHDQLLGFPSLALC